MAENKKQFPGLYPSEQIDIANQQKLIDHAWSPEILQKKVSDYNAAYQSLVDNQGLDKGFSERGVEKAPAFLKLYLKGILIFLQDFVIFPTPLGQFFLDLDLEFLQEKKPVPEVMPVETWDIFDKKMADAQELVEKLNAAFAVKPETPSQERLALAKRDQCKADLKAWFKR